MSSKILSVSRERQILKAAANTRLLVLGDVMLDQFIWGLVSRISPEAPVPVVVDAGLGAPSHAAEAMEMGADAVLVNTAVAVSSDPNRMAVAFKMAVEAGRAAYEAGLAAQQETASTTSPLAAFLD
jgi:thiazole synthase